ncbi:RraA family protein [Tessaracoccus terricola]
MSVAPVAQENAELDADGMLEALRTSLYTPVVGDILDARGLAHQFLPPSVMPLQPGMKVAGRAMTVLMIDVFGPQKKPFGRLTEALDDLRPNEVYLATGGTQRCAYWGEMLTATARTRGAVGAVVNGYHRDTPQVLEQDWPVFSWGPWAQDSSIRTQVVDFRCRIEIGGVQIDDGDIVFGDLDGVLVIPSGIALSVVEEAMEKASQEKLVRRAIEGGMTATAAFAKYGIL